MAKPVKRRQPAKRKAAKSGMSGFAFSGWIVATGIGLAWAAPHFGVWPHAVITDVASSSPNRNTDLSPRVQPQPAKSQMVPRGQKVPAVEIVPATRLNSRYEPADRAADAPTQKTAFLTPIPKARIPQMDTRLNAKPAVDAGSMMAAKTVRSDDKPGNIAETGMPIRKFPFVTAETVTRVDDLRRVRIVGGQGDWKKVEILPGGQIGWIQLKRYRERDVLPRAGNPTAMTPPDSIKPVSVPAEALLNETRAGRF